MIGENIYNDIELLSLNFPKNISPIEKVRWLYIKLGKLFSYDYTILDGDEVKRIDYDKQYINSYQTCIGVSQILYKLLNNIDENIKCNIIERDTVRRGRFDENHKANEIIIGNEKYILDLTLDLQLIQSGCRTKEFGFTTNANGDYDIISMHECEEMDRKLGLISLGEYTDKKINDAKSILGKINFNNMTIEEEIRVKINKMQELIPDFNGFFEGKNYINKLFLEILGFNYKEFNIYKGKRMVTCFEVMGDKPYWYIYGNEVGLFETDPSSILSLLENEWETRSKTLLDEIYNQEKKFML